MPFSDATFTGDWQCSCGGMRGDDEALDADSTELQLHWAEHRQPWETKDRDAANARSANRTIKLTISPGAPIVTF